MLNLDVFAVSSESVRWVNDDCLYLTSNLNMQLSLCGFVCPGFFSEMVGRTRLKLGGWTLNEFVIFIAVLVMTSSARWLTKLSNTGNSRSNISPTIIPGLAVGSFALVTPSFIIFFKSIASSVFFCNRSLIIFLLLKKVLRSIRKFLVSCFHTLKLANDFIQVRSKPFWFRCLSWCRCNLLSLIICCHLWFCMVVCCVEPRELLRTRPHSTTVSTISTHHKPYLILLHIVICHHQHHPLKEQKTTISLLFNYLHYNPYILQTSKQPSNRWNT